MDQISISEILNIINEEDATIAEKVLEAIPEIEAVPTQNIVKEEPPKEQEPLISDLEESETAPVLEEFIDPVFKLVTREFGSLQLGKRAVPAFLDVDGDRTTANGYDYFMYSIGGSYDIGMFTFDLNWTEAESGAGKAGGPEATEAVILSVSSSW